MLSAKLKSKSIFLLYPSEKEKYIKEIKKRLEGKAYGFKKVYIMRYEKQKATDPTLAHKFDTIYKKSKFVFAFFFKDLTNVSVNFEIGFIHGKECHKFNTKLQVLSEKGVDFAQDNPYLSSGKGINILVADFKEKFTESDEHYDPCQLIHSFVVVNSDK